MCPFITLCVCALYMPTCIHVCRLCLCVQVYMYFVCVHLCVHAHVHVCVFPTVYLHTHVCMYICASSAYVEEVGVLHTDLRKCSLEGDCG